MAHVAEWKKEEVKEEVKQDNVLVDDNGRLFFIDPLIRLKKSALEVIEWLVGPIRT